MTRRSELVSFLAVGGAGYVVDVGGFNVLRSWPVLGAVDPSWSKALAVVAAMGVTYAGNAMVTWRGDRGSSRRREVALFALFNAIGLGFSLVALWVSHDAMGLTSRFADNVSANVVGLGLGTVFRYVAYRTWVFAGPSYSRPRDRPHAPGSVRDQVLFR